MITLGLVFALIIGTPQQGNSGSIETQSTMQDAQSGYERHKQAAIRINELAGQIRSEVDASAVVEEIANLFGKELPPAWVSTSIRQRIAYAEYQTVHTSANLIPEQRVVDVWNQYVKEIGAPDEAMVSVTEIHNMRDASFSSAQWMWARGMQTIWTMPNVYALGPDGEVADGCQALEALRVIHDLDGLFQNLLSARDRLRKGIVPSAEFKKRTANPNSQPHSVARLEAHTGPNPIRVAEQRYVQENGAAAHEQLLLLLFDELFPTK